MKIIVFENKLDLRKFWKRNISDFDLGEDCLGAVNALCYERWRDGRSTMIVDPVYFCAMGLIKGHLGMEVITHEAVHAAFAYAKRVSGKNMWAGALDLDEESVCYPAGRIASMVSKFLSDEGL